MSRPSCDSTQRGQPLSAEDNDEHKERPFPDTISTQYPLKKKRRLTCQEDSSKCKLCKKPTENARCCPNCVGAIFGAIKFPVCRICHWFFEYGQRGCYCDSTRRFTTCATCKQVRLRDDFFLSASNHQLSTTIRSCVTGSDCFLCQPNHLEEQWTIHRPIIWELGRHGIQIFDCDAALASKPFQRTLPPAPDLVGSYDAIYLRWETVGNGPFNSLAFGDILQKRSICGSLQLSLLESNATMEESSVYSRLQGVLKLPSCDVYHDSMHDQITDLPPNKKIAFRFSDGNTSIASANCGCISVCNQGETALAYIEDLALNRETSWNPRQLESMCTWQAYHGSTVSLQTIKERTSFDWIPRDGYNGESQYAQKLRQEIRSHRRPHRDWSRSWLRTQLELPENVCMLITGYLALPDCFQPAFIAEKGDLWLSISFLKPPRSLHVKFLARKSTESARGGGPNRSSRR